MNLDTILKWVGNPNNAWIPIIVFSIILLMAWGFGFMLGTKSALYFAGWNIVGTLIMIFTLKYFVSSLTKYLTDSVNNITSIDSLDPKDIMNVLVDEYGGLWIAVLLMMGLVCINILAFIFYLFFRKKLKRTMIENKNEGLSNIGIRFRGLGVATIGVLPFLSTMGTVSNVTTTTSFFTKTNSSLFTGATFGQEKGIESGEDIGVLLETIEWITNKNLANGIKDIFSAITGSDVQDTTAAKTVIAAYKDKLSRILNNSIINSKAMPKLIEQVLKNNAQIDSSSIDLNDPNIPINDIFSGNELDLKEEVKENLKRVLNEKIEVIGSNKDEFFNELVEKISKK